MDKRRKPTADEKSTTTSEEPRRKPRKARTVDQLKAAYGLAIYDASMLQILSQGLSTGVFGAGPTGNAVLESLLLHARILLAFMYGEEKAYPDDVLAEDFFEDRELWSRIRPPLSQRLNETRVRASKEVAHLTYTSAEKTPEARIWPFQVISVEVLNVFSKFDEAYAAEAGRNDNVEKPHVVRAGWLTLRPQRGAPDSFTIQLTPEMVTPNNVVPISAQGYYRLRQFKGATSITVSEFVNRASWEETVRDLFRQWCIAHFDEARTGELM